MVLIPDTTHVSRGDSSVMLQPGALLFGKFRILRRLGAGNMGTVYECTIESSPGERVAIKLLRNSASRSDRAAARFRNELHASYRVSHSCVVRGKEFFRTEEYLAFTMELIRGRSLADFLVERNKLTPREVISILSQLCAGLGAIHEAGIIHRDVKPHNILMTDNGKVKVTDFSAAQFKNPPPGYDETEIIGTVSYMSPEALSGQLIDARSDIYSLGVLGYELITGHTPFENCEYADEPVFKAHFVPPAPHQFTRDCPRHLSKLLLKAMAPRADDRFQSVREMALALDPLANPSIDSGLANHAVRSNSGGLGKRAPVSYRRMAVLMALIALFSIPIFASTTPVIQDPATFETTAVVLEPERDALPGEGPAVESPPVTVELEKKVRRPARKAPIPVPFKVQRNLIPDP